MDSFVSIFPSLTYISWYGWSAQEHIHFIMPVIGTVIFGFGLVVNLWVCPYPSESHSPLTSYKRRYPTVSRRHICLCFERVGGCFREFFYNIPNFIRHVHFWHY